MIILFVHRQVLLDVVDLFCENGNLDFRRTGVVLVRLIFFDDIVFFPVSKHLDIPYLRAEQTPARSNDRILPAELMTWVYYTLYFSILQG